MAKKKEIIKKWSYSRYSCYHQCPAQYEYRYVLKLDKFVSSPAMERGLKIHALAENFIIGKITGLPDALKLFKDEFKTMRRLAKKGSGFAEPDLSFNKDGTASNRKKSDYFVGFLDFVNFDEEEITIIDFKTGRQYPTHVDQAHAYAMACFQLNPKVKNITTEFYYLDSGEVKSWEYESKNKDRMYNLWEKRIDKMYADKTFRKTPHKFCNWCNRNKKNGGDCSG